MAETEGNTREPVPLTEAELDKLTDAGIPTTLELSYPAPVVMREVFREIRKGDGAEGMRVIVDRGSNGDRGRESLWFDDPNEFNIYGLNHDQLVAAGHIANSRPKVDRREELVDESSVYIG